MLKGCHYAIIVSILFKNTTLAYVADFNNEITKKDGGVFHIDQPDTEYQDDVIKSISLSIHPKNSLIDTAYRDEARLTKPPIRLQQKNVRLKNNNRTLINTLSYRTLRYRINNSDTVHNNSVNSTINSLRTVFNSVNNNVIDNNTVNIDLRPSLNGNNDVIKKNNNKGKDDVTKGQHGPHHEFHHYEVVYPHVIHGRTKRHIQTSKDVDGHLHDITIGININGKKELLDLQLNRDLLPRNYFEKAVGNKSHRIHRPSSRDVDLCQYQGFIRNQPNSWAAISTCQGISGVVFDGNSTHYIERDPESEPSLSSPHYLFNHIHLKQRDHQCGYSSKPHNITGFFQDENFSKLVRHKRSTEGVNIRGPYNANLKSRYVELVLVADHTEYEKHGHNIQKIYQRCKDIANIVNALYRPLNIFIALVGVEVWHEKDQVKISDNGDTTLTNFLTYRKMRLIPDHPNDNAQLLTGKVFKSGVVGKALKGPMCTYQYSGGVSMDHSNTVALVATTVAHEMGHNFGMEHDNEEDCKCQESRCIMAPSSGTRSPSHWSTCSYEFLALAFERSMDYCLRNKPEKLFDSPVCGNGFVEPGEQCDCGLPQYCTNTCCNATTCMLHYNATCATGHCCDLETCRPRSAGYVCRAALYECDLPEYCSGSSEYCPENYFKEDGHECHGGQAYCFDGRCRTHEQQCQLLWGPTGESSHDSCYDLNKEGDSNGNCGYNWVNETYYKCRTEDTKCGMMHCKHLNERLEFGMESVSKVTHKFIRDRKGFVACRVAQVDLGLDMVDPGLAPDGSKCGYGKMCVDQKCMPVAALRRTDCDCKGNGVCNNLGHCHCDVGFSPPDCLYPGHGGSKDSGPASNPHGGFLASDVFAMSLYILFLGIVPITILITCLVYFIRGTNAKIWLQNKTRSATSRLSNMGDNRRFRPCVEVQATIPNDRNASPTSSHGSKSNSPLLNGHANNGEKADFSTNFFGKHEGYTLSPIKEKKLVAQNGGPPTLVPINRPLSPSDSPTKSASSTGQDKTSVVISNNTPNPGWNIKPAHLPANIWPPNSSSKISISGPSLQASTNPAVAPVAVVSSDPSEKAASETNTPSAPLKDVITPINVPKYESPPPSYNSVIGQPPPVAVVNPMKRPPRPLSVPDGSAIINNTANTVQKEESNPKQDSSKLSTVSRIASFLTKKDKSDSDSNSEKSNTLPRKAAKINRESLLQLEISGPIQLQATELPNNLVPVRPAPDIPMPSNVLPSKVKSQEQEGQAKGKVSWAKEVEEKSKDGNNKDKTESKISNKDLQRFGSVRENSVTSRPSIPKFGSMRAQRPKSLPPTRPSQPPPQPPLPAIPGSPEVENIYNDIEKSGDSTFETPGSPNDSIYETIDENPKEIIEKKPKKSILSFLYSRPKTKKTEEKEPVKEPVYMNVNPKEEETQPDEETSPDHIYSTPATSPVGSPVREKSASPPAGSDRTSCGSSDDGGLLSEIVTELATREPELISSLAKKKNKKNVKTPSSVPSVSKNNKEKDHSSNKPSNEGNSKSKPTPSVDSNKNKQNLQDPKPNVIKGQNYPWRSNKTQDSPKDNPVDPSQKSPEIYHRSPIKTYSMAPRGVFSSLMKRDFKNKENTTDSSVKSTDTSVKTTDKDSSTLQQKNTPVASVHTTITKPKTLAESLAAVRAAGTAAGQAAAAATLAKEERNKLIKGDPNDVKINSNVNNTISISNETKNKLPHNTVTPETNKSADTTDNSKNSQATKPSKIVFPPDKVIFPPDKVLTSPVTKNTPSQNIKTNPSGFTGAKEKSNPQLTKEKSNPQLSKEKSNPHLTKEKSNPQLTKEKSNPQISNEKPNIKNVKSTIASRTAGINSGRGGRFSNRATTPNRTTTSFGNAKTEGKKGSLTPQSSIESVASTNKPTNSLADKNKPKIPDKSKDLTQDKTGIKKPTSSIKPVSNISARRPVTAGTGRGGSTASARATSAGTISNVASLQKKFEKEAANDKEAERKPLPKNIGPKSTSAKPTLPLKSKINTNLK